ncbi:MAG: DUF1893 domain-containing protein [Candidatus Micrarchaeia archaeon]
MSTPSLIVKRDGRIIHRSHARGLRPLALLFFNGRDILEGADVFDKVVGEAAARLFVLARARSVEAGVASEPALERLARAGVRASAHRVVEAILRADGRGRCSMEILSGEHPGDDEFVAALSKIFAGEGHGVRARA